MRSKKILDLNIKISIGYKIVLCQDLSDSLPEYLREIFQSKNELYRLEKIKVEKKPSVDATVKNSNKKSKK